MLDSRISVVDDHLTSSLYRKLIDDLNLLHCSNFHPKHVRKSISYAQSLLYHWIFSDTFDCDRHLKILKALLKGNMIGYNNTLVDCQFLPATRISKNEIFRRREMWILLIASV